MNDANVRDITKFKIGAVLPLAGIMSLRLLGLFMIVPVLSLYVTQLAGYTPLLLGLAAGVYGLTQGLLQIPFGTLSDHIGRRPVIALGLVIFGLGSVICALAGSIWVMILGRALQGAGAIGSTIIATIADVTPEEHRTKAMAVNGIIIGLSFSIAMVLGPLAAAGMGVQGIFWLALGFSLLGLAILFKAIPATIAKPPVPVTGSWLSLLQNNQLLRLNSGIFLLHAMFTASFVVLPLTLRDTVHLSTQDQWHIYLPALLIAFVLSFLAIYYAEKKRQLRRYFLGGIVILALSELAFGILPSLQGMAFGITLFFTGFSLLEAFLPSLISRAAPAQRRGTAMGIYSCCQFLGIFVGGLLGGYLYSQFGLQQVYFFCFGVALVWLTIAIGMQHPQRSSA